MGDLSGDLHSFESLGLFRSDLEWNLLGEKGGELIFCCEKTYCMIFILSPKSVARKLLVDGFDLQIEVSIATTVITCFFYGAHI